MPITLYFFGLVIGAVFLALSADRFITASVAVAKYFNIPRIVIGIVLVGFGTSFPELIVSMFASLHGNGEIAVGNVVGSNIANIGLVLGLVALIIPIQVSSRLIKQELPILIFISIILGFIFWPSTLYRWEGVVLLLLLSFHLWWAFMKGSKEDAIMPQIEEEMKTGLSIKAATMWWFVGLIILFVSSEIFIQSAVAIARWFHIDELIIGLTVVTIGTSLPELAATIVSALKKEYDIAAGHIVGSNIFNSLAVLAMPALINPGKISEMVIKRDYPVMLGFTLVLWLVLVLTPKEKQIGRIFGGVLLLGYVAYLCLLAFAV
jgi:cation:H+ antiporter